MAFFTKRYHPPGTAPGTLVEVPRNQAREIRIRLIDYTADSLTVLEEIDSAACQRYMQDDSVTWIHIEGHPTEQALSDLYDAFGLHELALEDVMNSGQRPKIESFDGQLFIVMNMPLMVDGLVDTRQVSLFVVNNTLVSFCQGDFAPFAPLVKRLRNDTSMLRKKGVDFLLYAFLDIVIDQGFPVLDDLGQQLEDLEDSILNSANDGALQQIHITKRELIQLRRMLWPQREVINHLMHGEFGIISAETRVYFRDCYDHTIQIMDFLETYREMASSMLDIYLSSLSNGMNDIMRLLTVISTIFIPLTFIVGVYGMNFSPAAGPLSMPELNWPFGYLAIWLLMVLIAVQMLAFFRRRKWI